MIFLSGIKLTPDSTNKSIRLAQFTGSVDSDRGRFSINLGLLSMDVNTFKNNFIFYMTNRIEYIDSSFGSLPNIAGDRKFFRYLDSSNNLSAFTDNSELQSFITSTSNYIELIVSTGILSSNLDMDLVIGYYE